VKYAAKFIGDSSLLATLVIKLVEAWGGCGKRIAMDKGVKESAGQLRPYGLRTDTVEYPTYEDEGGEA
jgi:hypothetical protein